ncbi:hypothetical protein JHK86_044809 [Glycine max]|nr:hypothetical protein JHK86_044809 [Glycine max]
MECETSVMVSEENSKEEDDLLLQSIRKVKRKANEKEIPLEREVEYKKIGGEENYPYKEKFLSSEGAIPFSAFDGGCYGIPNKDILPSPISKEDKERFQEKGSLIVIVLGKKMGFYHLEAKLKCDWARKVQLTKWMTLKNLVVEDIGIALIECDIGTLRWRPFFLANPLVGRKLVVWIRIPELLIELFNDQFLWRLGSTLGEMLKIDQVTTIQSKGKFARICIELDLDKSLQPKIGFMFGDEILKDNQEKAAIALGEGAMQFFQMQKEIRPKLLNFDPSSDRINPSFVLRSLLLD